MIRAPRSSKGLTLSRPRELERHALRGLADREATGACARTLIIAEREANRRLLAERMRALGASAPACVDSILAAQLAELAPSTASSRSSTAQGLHRARQARMVDCQRALDRGYAAAEATDRTRIACSPSSTAREVSAAWYRRTYGELTGRRPPGSGLPF